MTNPDEIISRLEIESADLHEYSQREGGKQAYEDACMIDDTLALLRYWKAEIEKMGDCTWWDGNEPYEVYRLEQYATELLKGVQDE